MTLLFLLFPFVAAVRINQTQMAAVEEIFSVLNDDSYPITILVDPAGVECPTESSGGGILTCTSRGDVDAVHAPNLQLNGNFSLTDWSALVNVSYINFANNSLYGSVPETIGTLARLSFLYLNDNKLGGRFRPIYQSRAGNNLRVCIIFSGASDANCFADIVSDLVPKCARLWPANATFCAPRATSTGSVPSAATLLSESLSATLSATLSVTALLFSSQLLTDASGNIVGGDPEPKSDADVVTIAVCGTIAGALCIVSMLVLGWWIGRKNGRMRPKLSSAIEQIEDVPVSESGVPEVQDDNYVSLPVMPNSPIYDKALPQSSSGTYSKPKSPSYTSAFNRLW